jgi:hypothetical protein
MRREERGAERWKMGRDGDTGKVVREFELAFCFVFS